MSCFFDQRPLDFQQSQPFSATWKLFSGGGGATWQNSGWVVAVHWKARLLLFSCQKYSVLLGSPWPALRGPLWNHFWKKRCPQPYWRGENSGDVLEASDSSNCRVWGVRAVLSRRNSRRSSEKGFRGLSKIFPEVPAVLGLWPSFGKSLSPYRIGKHRHPQHRAKMHQKYTEKKDFLYMYVYIYIWRPPPLWPRFWHFFYDIWYREAKENQDGKPCRLGLNR